MAFSGVPVAIEGGGAGIAGKLFRQMVADFVRGTDGVMRDTDLALRARPAPNNEILMGAGGATILNRALGGTREGYYDYNDEDVPIAIRGTGSSGGRSDLVIAWVLDPYAAGSQYQKPPDPTKGPYVFPWVVENVDKRVYRVQQLGAWAGESAITLGRVTQPANNNAITPAMVQDLRYLANGPQRYQEPVAQLPPDPPPPILGENPWTESRIQQTSQELSSTSWTNWPSDASWRVPVPVDANGVDMYAVVQNPRQRISDCTGEARMSMGDWAGYPSPIDLPAISADKSNRLPVFYSTTFRWGRSDGIAGSLQTFRFQARRTGSSPGRMSADGGTIIYISLNFKTRPIIN